MRKVLLFLLLLFLLLGAAATVAWNDYRNFLSTPLDIPPGGQVFLLEPGTAGTRIVEQLAGLGMTRPNWRWRLLMRLEPRVYRSGEYRLEAGTTPPELLRTLASGDVVTYRFTLVEGWTFRQLTEALAADEVLEHELDFDIATQWGGLAQAFGFDHPEGWFLPETYQFTRGDSDRDILSRAHEAMQQALQDAWSERGDELPLDSPYELLILASIIEKETALDSERETIAGVFVRRLNQRMRLQTDPTVIYGMGDNFDGDIRRRDLRTDTPYNTYTRHGLPPTPIAMPGRQSLRAAARPEPGTALYFVADGKGGHTFSDTLEEHQAAVKKFLENKG
jgi:UPF0755 protein